VPAVVAVVAVVALPEQALAVVAVAALPEHVTAVVADEAFHVRDPKNVPWKKPLLNVALECVPPIMEGTLEQTTPPVPGYVVPPVTVGVIFATHHRGVPAMFWANSRQFHFHLTPSYIHSIAIRTYPSHFYPPFTVPYHSTFCPSYLKSLTFRQLSRCITHSRCMMHP